MKSLTHLNEQGEARMVDVSDKPDTERTAVASALLRADAETLKSLRERSLPKGDALATARIAGIMAAKKTSDLIPLCHPLPISSADVAIELGDETLSLVATVKTVGKTGVEMEALTAVSVAALTIYDMCKAIDRGMTIERIQLERKSGGKSGDYVRR